MLICCPKCNISYDIGAAVIPAEGKKVRCSQCGEVWTCTPADLFEQPQPQPIMPAAEEQSAQKNQETENAQENQETTEESPVSAEKTEMQEIFARLETQTEKLFAYEKNLPPYLKIWYGVKSFFGLQRRRNRRVLAGFSVVLFLLLLFYMRFDIVRIAPFMEKVYAAFNIESVITGEGLEFQNITRNEYEEDYVNKMEIRGFIANQTGKTLNIPTLQIKLFDKNAQALQVIYQQPPVPRIVAGSKVAFRIIITKPSSFSKYVYLTFTREQPSDTVKAVNIRSDEI